MGVGVSHWKLARAVSARGQLGVVSGTALDIVISRRLQIGDPGAHVRRALRRFPDPLTAESVLKEYYIPGGKLEEARFKPLGLFTATPTESRQKLAIVASFVETYLAKEGHDGSVGINLLEKIQCPTLPTLYGAMLAGVDYVLMGAGIPREIPGVLDCLAEHRGARLHQHVENAASGSKHRLTIDPRGLLEVQLTTLKRPKFLPIVSSATLAAALLKKATGKIDGFIVEGPTAGGHVAPPRGPMNLNTRGEPIYGPKDAVDFKKMKSFGLPFWLAGSYGSPEKLREAVELGATGVQVGTAFALCEESGIAAEIKSRLLRKLMAGEAEVFTDPVASPAGFPFKVVSLEGSLSDQAVYEARPRRCDLGYLRTAHAREDGSLGYRCPAEPEDAYVNKGGKLEDTRGRKCLCNGLLATIGLAEGPSGERPAEPPLVTAGEELKSVKRLLKRGSLSYCAASVIDYLLVSDPSADARAVPAVSASLS